MPRRRTATPPRPEDPFQAETPSPVARHGGGVGAGLPALRTRPEGAARRPTGVRDVATVDAVAPAVPKRDGGTPASPGPRPETVGRPSVTEVGRLGTCLPGTPSRSDAVGAVGECYTCRAVATTALQVEADRRATAGAPQEGAGFVIRPRPPAGAPGRRAAPRVAVGHVAVLVAKAAFLALGGHLREGRGLCHVAGTDVKAVNPAMAGERDEGGLFYCF